MTAARHYADAENWAIEHAHPHEHPEIGHSDRPIHHEQWGISHAHEHRFHPVRSDHHPVDPHPVVWPDDDQADDDGEQATA